jgi:hypothetical protein
MEIDEKLRELSSATSKVDQSLAPASLVEQPAMQEIRRIASKILRQILSNS